VVFVCLFLEALALQGVTQGQPFLNTDCSLNILLNVGHLWKSRNRL